MKAKDNFNFEGKDNKRLNKPVQPIRKEQRHGRILKAL